MQLTLRTAEGREPDYIVEGYASTFDEYTLFSVDGVDYRERIDPHAFDEADMSDVVFRVDHEGPVYARSSAGTVAINADERGLHQVADLSRTARSRAIYDEIAAGNYPQMSFAFTVAQDHVERGTHTRVIDRIAKVFDVSPVSFPANPNTFLTARSLIDGAIEQERAERREAERRVEQRERIRKLLEVSV
jgi:HK97 family phage prohead protease